MYNYHASHTLFGMQHIQFFTLEILNSLCLAASQSFFFKERYKGQVVPMIHCRSYTASLLVGSAPAEQNLEPISSIAVHIYLFIPTVTAFHGVSIFKGC